MPAGQASSGDAALAAFIARVRKLGGLREDAAKRAAPLVEAAAKRTASAGTTPDGAPWQPRKDGGRPLAHAADALSAEANGPAVVLALRGVEVIHNFGDHRNPKRQILPDGGSGIPKNIAEALNDGARDAFLDTMRGA